MVEVWHTIRSSSICVIPSSCLNRYSSWVPTLVHDCWFGTANSLEHVQIGLVSYFSSTTSRSRWQSEVCVVLLRASVHAPSVKSPRLCVSPRGKQVSGDEGTWRWIRESRAWESTEERTVACGNATPPRGKSRWRWAKGGKRNKVMRRSDPHACASPAFKWNVTNFFSFALFASCVQSVQARQAVRLAHVLLRTSTFLLSGFRDVVVRFELIWKAFAPW